MEEIFSKKNVRSIPDINKKTKFYRPKNYKMYHRMDSSSKDSVYILPVSPSMLQYSKNSKCPGQYIQFPDLFRP